MDSGLAWWAVYLGTVILVSVLAFQCVEEPARQWIRARLAKPAAQG